MSKPIRIIQSLSLSSAFAEAYLLMGLATYVFFKSWLLALLFVGIAFACAFVWIYREVSWMDEVEQSSERVLEKCVRALEGGNDDQRGNS